MAVSSMYFWVWPSIVSLLFFRRPSHIARLVAQTVINAIKGHASGAFANVLQVGRCIVQPFLAHRDATASIPKVICRTRVRASILGIIVGPKLWAYSTSRCLAVRNIEGRSKLSQCATATRCVTGLKVHSHHISKVAADTFALPCSPSTSLASEAQYSEAVKNQPSQIFSSHAVVIAESR